jgi:predicted Zn-dependent peptidase
MLYLRKLLILITVGCIMGISQANEVLINTENIYVEKLDNGATAIVKERDDTEAVAVQVWFAIGSIYENDKERGISHFLEHMLFNGTKHTKPGEIEQEVEKKGGSINAATSYDFTYYHIEIAAPFWETALQYLYWMTTEPTLSDEMVKKEKPIVLEELNRHLDNPKSVLWDTYNKLAYKVSNYKHPVIGYRETIENFTGELVRNYFNTHYVPSVMNIVVVGKVDKEKVMKKIRETFGTVKKKEYTPPPVPLEPEQKEIRKKTLKKNQVTRAYVAIGWQAPSIRSKDTFTLNVLEEILAGGRTSVLSQEIKEKGLAQGIFGGYMAHIGTGQFLFYYVTEPEKIKVVKDKIFEILENYKENGVPEEVVEDAKNKIINGEIFAREEVSHDAESLGYAKAVANDINYDVKFVENIQKVTKKDVDEYIRKHFNENNFTEVELLPEN